MISFIDIFLRPFISRSESGQTAFVINGREYSYADLYCLVSQIYQLLEDVPDSNVYLYATDDIRTYATILALWFHGKAYVPLNPNQPKDRHLEVIKSVAGKFILSSDGKYNPGV